MNLLGNAEQKKEGHHDRFFFVSITGNWGCQSFVLS
jgi:hypothetical protein